ncbi:hypothetical protein [Xanthomonas vasicola]|uniref:hypothetical protein n=1 Tax=Xanthomonas vasicola TaxID=56459 RepID=UPI00117D10F3|nr:hypothetical protein [Xanthomonas vasicola]
MSELQSEGSAVLLLGLARPPSQDTLQVRPCKLLGGIHAAKGPATVSRQGPVELVGLQRFQQATSRPQAQSSHSLENHQPTVW